MTEGSPGWRLAAPAKLNLWLTVTGRRPDGFHELDSALVLLELADDLTWEPGERAFHVRGPASGVPPDRTNLAWRGWDVGRAGIDPAGGLVLEKRVPAAAGLGGGSSDAAAGWRLGGWVTARGDAPANRSELAELARLGADVPFFAAQAAAARIGGIGEQVVEMPLPDAREVVLVHPPFELATAAVFAELRRGEWTGSIDGPSDVPDRNDLEPAARRLRPELDDVFRAVAGAGGGPQLTGSGPTVFALTDDAERAAGIVARLARAGLRATRTRVRSAPASIEPLDPLSR